MDEQKPPRIENAPGIVWRKRRNSWTAVWQARHDLIKKGYMPTSTRLWNGQELSAVEAGAIAMHCQRLQADMLMWARNGGYVSDTPTVTLRDVLNKYQTDPDSSYHKKRYSVRKNHDTTLRRISEKLGDTPLADIKGRLIIAWHKEWSADGQKVAMGHTFVGHLRTIFGFGAALLEDPECERLCAVMHKMRFPQQKPRTQRLTADMAIAVRAKAHERGWPYMALAQAIQFELMLRQKDVIGEYVPLSEPGVSDVATAQYGKWFRGLRWEEVDQNAILRHTTSKRGKDIEVDLRFAPMVLEELEEMFPGTVTVVVVTDPITKKEVEKIVIDRSLLPTSGPVITNEVTGWPYTTAEFRRKWRKVATMAGIPKEVRNMDSRAGAITEATEAGIPLEHIKHAATHSDISMTQRYARGGAEKTAITMQGRSAHRNKGKT